MKTTTATLASVKIQLSAITNESDHMARYVVVGKRSFYIDAPVDRVTGERFYRAAGATTKEAVSLDACAAAIVKALAA